MGAAHRVFTVSYILYLDPPYKGICLTGEFSYDLFLYSFWVPYYRIRIQILLYDCINISLQDPDSQKIVGS